MRKIVMAAALVGLALSGPATAGRDWYGVDMEAVPWATFCPSVKPVVLETESGDCPRAHPAGPNQGEWRDVSWAHRPEPKRPKPNCDIEENQYWQWTNPVEGVKEPWHMCRRAWAMAIKARAEDPSRFAEPFATWRAQWFGSWLFVSSR